MLASRQVKPGFKSLTKDNYEAMRSLTASIPFGIGRSLK